MLPFLFPAFTSCSKVSSFLFFPFYMCSFSITAFFCITGTCVVRGEILLCPQLP